MVDDGLFFASPSSFESLIAQCRTLQDRANSAETNDNAPARLTP